MVGRLELEAAHADRLRRAGGLRHGARRELSRSVELGVRGDGRVRDAHVVGGRGAAHAVVAGGGEEERHGVAVGGDGEVGDGRRRDLLGFDERLDVVRRGLGRALIGE